MEKASRVVETLKGARRLVWKGWSQFLPMRTEHEDSADFADWLWRLFGKSVEWPRKGACEARKASDFTLNDALWKASGGDSEAVEMAEELLRPMVPHFSALLWELSPGRRKDEVIALLDKAIARADRLATAEREACP
jgi:hypothetical protein